MNATVTMGINTSPQTHRDELKEKMDVHYKLQRILGEGAFCKVFHATEKASGQDVAVKRLTHIGKDASEQKTDALREFLLGRFLNHRNIVETRDWYIHLSLNQYSFFFDINIFCSIRTRDFTFIVLELVPDGDLYSYLQPNAPGLKELEARQIMRDIASAMQYMHKLGLVHGDLKPENVLIKGGRAKVSDFG